jgi:hypothetical protein
VGSKRIVKKGTKVLKLVESWGTYNSTDDNIRTWYVADGELVGEKDLLYSKCGSIINWKLLHSNLNFEYGLIEISEGEYGD